MYGSVAIVWNYKTVPNMTEKTGSDSFVVMIADTDLM